MITSAAASITKLVDSSRWRRRRRWRIHSSPFLAFSDIKIEARTPLSSNQQSVWPDWAKFCHFVEILKVLSKYIRIHLVFGKILNILGLFCYVIGQSFIVVNGQILKRIFPSGHTVNNPKRRGSSKLRLDFVLQKRMWLFSSFLYHNSNKKAKICLGFKPGPEGW